MKIHGNHRAFDVTVSPSFSRHICSVCFCLFKLLPCMLEMGTRTRNSKLSPILKEENSVMPCEWLYMLKQTQLEANSATHIKYVYIFFRVRVGSHLRSITSSVATHQMIL